MTYQFWTRFITTSLILLSQSVFASEFSRSSDYGVTPLISNDQALPAESFDNISNDWIESTTMVTQLFSGANLSHLALLFTSSSIAQSPRYGRYRPRAPPISPL